LSWTAPSGTTTSYNVYRGTTSGGETLQQSGVSGTSFTDTGLTDGTTYYYEVAAVNGVGESARSNEASATPATATPPSQPQSVAAHAVTNTISVTWAAPASSGGSAVTGYNVYRSTTAGGEGTTAYATGISGTSFTDTGVAAGATYYYVVTAVNGVGEGARSAETSATANNVPSQITNLSARTSSSRGVRLTWSAPGNGGATISGYRIYRSTSSGTETLYVTVTCSSSSCSYNDSGTTRNRIYYYQVAAYNAVGQAALSNESSARAR
jgi:fibronectin type 3 domain-containing protein